MSSVDLTVKISLLFVVQIAHVIFVIVVRSPIHVSSQISEIINEVVFSVLIIFLFFWENRSQWTEAGMYFFISIVIGSFTIQLIINLCKCIQAIMI